MSLSFDAHADVYDAKRAEAMRHAMRRHNARRTAPVVVADAPSSHGKRPPRRLSLLDARALGVALWRDERGSVAPSDALLIAGALLLALGVAYRLMCHALDGARVRSRSVARLARLARSDRRYLRLAHIERRASRRA